MRSLGRGNPLGYRAPCFAAPDPDKKPIAVRYAWADNPACNLVNGADLPAAPFRTDDW